MSRIEAVASQFQIPGHFLSAQPYGSGHINDTWCAVFQQTSSARRYILQRINSNVFKQPAAVMENIQRVTAHLAQQLTGDPEQNRRVLRLIPASDGQFWHIDSFGSYWRAYHFIEDARSYDAIQTAEQACQAAKAFGRFQQQLADLPAPRLHDTIPGFHHTPNRFRAFEQSLAADAANRAALAAPEIRFALAHQPIVNTLLEANLPERVTHNDTKISNVLLDNRTGEGLCVIDLDTVMPGLAVFDFADLVRTTTSPAAEDEQDLSQVAMQFPLFAALAHGYLSSARAFLTREEKEHLAFASKLITFEQGLRFLTDFLNGDIYYKTHRPHHNLDRCRTQFQLVQSIAHQEEQMTRLIQSLG